MEKETSARKHLRFIRVDYIVGWEAMDSGLGLMYADGRRELIRMSAKEADENSEFMINTRGRLR